MKVIDLSGQVFGRLTVSRRLENTPAGKAVWECRCECGALTKTTGGHLKSGHTSSCGCAKLELAKQPKYVFHGHRKGGRSSPTYMVWRGIMSRCYLSTVRNYSDYGGRGIKVDEEWHKFENFLRDMGKQPPGLDIDRINNNGDYGPGNCRWVTRKENNNNRRSNRLVTFDGKTMTITQWSEITGINKHTIRNRLNSGWTIPKALGL